MLSIIIVNYHSSQLIIDCLRSIYLFEPDAHYEFIIVNNASSEEDKKRLLDEFPGVKWIDMGYNAGFARANNEGIRQSKGEIVLLLNPDILVEDDSIGGCYGRFLSSDDVACGVQLLNADKTPQISGNYFIKGGINNLLPLPFLGGMIKRMGELLKVKKTNIPEATDVVEVDWINGAFLMVKKEVIKKAGLLDEDFFLYAEEIEWCARIRKKGKLSIYGDLHVIHLQGETANESFGSTGKGYYNLFDRKGKQILVSNFLRIRKQFGVGWYLIQLIFYVADIPVFFICMLLQSLFKGRNRYGFSQFTGYCKNLFYLIGLSGKMIRNKPHFYKAI